MKLYWSPRSPYSRKVLVALHALDRLDAVAREEVVVSAQTRDADAAFLRRNPLRQIPTLERDDGSALYDSTVICLWLDRTLSPGALVPVDGDAYWDCQKREALGNGFILKLTRLYQEMSREAAKLSPLHIDVLRRTRENVLAALEEAAPALPVDRLDMGVVTLDCALAYLDFRFADLGWRDACPALAGWHVAARAAQPSLHLPGLRVA